MTKGGCLCGEVRYSIAGDPVAQLFCYCTDCVKVSGAAGYAAYVVQRGDLSIDQGVPTSYTVEARSGRKNTRNFCPSCGTRLWADLDTGVASVSGSSLDHPEVFQPTMIHCENDAPAWASIPVELASLPES